MESQVVDTGVHLECVTDLLGHASVATTRRHYVRAVRPTVPHAVGVDAVPRSGCPPPLRGVGGEVRTSGVDTSDRDCWGDHHVGKLCTNRSGPARAPTRKTRPSMWGRALPRPARIRWAANRGSRSHWHQPYRRRVTLSRGKPPKGALPGGRSPRANPCHPSPNPTSTDTGEPLAVDTRRHWLRAKGPLGSTGPLADFVGGQGRGSDLLPKMRRRCGGD